MPLHRPTIHSTHLLQKLTAILFLFLTPLLAHAQDSVLTLAGVPQVIGPTNGTGTNALLGDPTAIVMDAGGNYYFTDTANHAIRKITTNGVVTTFAGKLGVYGLVNATGTNAEFYLPNGLAFDKSGNLYVSDTGNNLIRKITTAGVVSTFAGVGGDPAYQDGPTTTALFSSPLGIVVWTNGNIFIADGGNHCIREIIGTTVSTFAGTPQIWGTNDATGTNAQFNAPCALTFDTKGNLFVSDANNDTIRKITTNAIVTTYAGRAGVDGTTDGTLTNARFRSPAGLAFDQKGNLYVADSYNQTIRKIGTNGLVTTVSGVAGVSGSQDGTNGVARYYNPYGLIVATNGALIVADAYNETIRVLLVPFQLSMQITNSTHTTTLTWSTVIGHTYQPQYQTNLSAPWLNLGPLLTSTNLTTTVTDTYTSGSHFYRVLQVN